MNNKVSLILLFVLFSAGGHSQELKNPSFEEVLSLPSLRNVSISPDGNSLVYELQTTDWKENRYDTEIWMWKEGGEPFQLTNNPDGSSTSAQWSPDSKWIAFRSKRGEHTQLQLIRAQAGEAVQLTKTVANIGSFEWSPNGKQIAFLQSDQEEPADKTRKEKFGVYEVDDEEFKLNRLYVIDVQQERLYQLPTPQQMEDSLYKSKGASRLMMDTVEYTINDFKWSPDGKEIAIEHQPNPLINTFFKADISILEVENKKIRPLIRNKSYDGLIDWSPDGTSLLYSSNLDDSTSNYYLNNKIYRIDKDGTTNVRLGESFDENFRGLTWTMNGIYGLALQKTKQKVVRINPANGKVDLLDSKLERTYNISIAKNGSRIAFSGSNDNDQNEVYVSDLKFKSISKITDMSSSLNGWATAESEVISWKSTDGAVIEGVLHKPKDYDPNKKYPLLVIIHGGPTGISVPAPVRSYVYPVVQWLNKGALVLRPNYRGSAGYGEEFRSLNVKNLGVGDAWDVISGVEYLEEQGMVDSNKIGCMGWSQGGYISAFLTTNTDKFQAFSVGAGISNWMTYYVNTDIHPFTRQYLKATPWSNEEIYRKTSPMTTINQASTPTLIQHGEFDRRVPIANAYELLQGLRDVGVPAKLIVYKGFGHGITKPKERLAANWHNWQWFAKYIWNEEVELPE